MICLYNFTYDIKYFHISLQKNADPLVINHILKVDQYTSINNLLEYYQMELRWVIQKRLLEIFSELCKLNFVVVEIIINSILPMELARYLYFCY